MIQLSEAVAVLAVEMLISDLLGANIQITPGSRRFWFGDELLNVIAKKTFHDRRQLIS
jgi:hypothetical protein